MSIRRNQVLSSAVSRRSFMGGTAALAGAAMLPKVRARSAGAQGDPVELRWSMWSATEAETEVWQGLADDVNAAYPNITVNLETTSFNDYWDKLQTQLASGTEADIIAMQSLRMPVFAARNAMRPLGPLYEAEDGFDYEDFFTPISRGLSFDGNVYAFGYDLGPIMLFYNKDLFNEAGVPLPSPTEPMSWEQFRETAAALTDADNNQYGFTIQPNFTAAIPWLWSGGGDYLNEEETQTLLDSEESLAALNFLIGLFTDDPVAAPITDLANTQFARETFNSGNVGMHQDGPWQFVNLREDAAFDWDVAPLPAGPAGSITWVAGSGFGISNTTDHVEEAWQALQVITSTESLEKVASSGRGYPARQSAVPAFIDPQEPPEHVDVVEQILNEDIASARFLKTTTTWQETEVMLQQEFNPVYLGEISVEETIERVVPRFNELLEKHQELLEAET